MLRDKLVVPLDDILNWWGGLLNSTYGAVTALHIRDELQEMREDVANAQAVIDPLLKAVAGRMHAPMSDTWDAINLAHQYENTLIRSIHTYVHRFQTDYAHRLSPMHLRVLGQMERTARQGCDHMERIKYYLRIGNMTRAINKVQISLRQLWSDRLIADHAISIDPAAHSVYANRQHNIRIRDELLSNARRFSDADKLRLITKQTDDHISIQLIHHGETLTPAQCDAIFEPGFQIKPDVEYAGLGLSIARQLARINSGDLSAHSTDEDLIFTLTLPPHNPETIS